MKAIVSAIPVLLLATTLAMAQEAGWVGVAVSEREADGVSVGSVEADSPASRAGVEPGDVIIEFDGRSVVGVRQFTRIVAETPVGRTVPVKLERNGQVENLEITLGSRPSRWEGTPFEFPEDLYALGERIRSGIPDVRIVTSVRRHGMRVDSMTPQLREFFGAARDEGVLIVSIEEDSPAAEAGLRTGDVIIAVGGETIDSPGGLRLIDTREDEVVLTILRDRSEQAVGLGLPATSR